MGLPIRVVIPLLTAFAVIFLGIMGYFLRSGLGAEGSAFGPSAQHEQGDARILATAAPGGPGGGANGLPGNAVGGGPPAPVMAALNELQARLSKNPRDTTALVSLGNMYLEAGKYDPALAYEERALAVNPKLGQALFAKGAALRGLGRRAQAVAAYRQFLHVAPNDPAAADARTAIAELGG